MRTIISILIIGAVLWLTLDNAEVVTIDLFFWDISASLALIIGVSFIFGFLLGMLRLTPGFLRRSREARATKRALEASQKERDMIAKRGEELSARVNELTPKPEVKNDAS